MKKKKPKPQPALPSDAPDENIIEFFEQAVGVGVAMNFDMHGLDPERHGALAIRGAAKALAHLWVMYTIGKFGLPNVQIPEEPCVYLEGAINRVLDQFAKDWKEKN